MSRNFETEYTRANDRIHPRKDLLKEMEAKWAAEEAQRAQEERKVVTFPVWARFLSAAAGILLCVGVGLGSVMLYSRGRGMRQKSAEAQAPLAVQGAMDMASQEFEEEEAKILYEAPAAEADEAPAEGEPETVLTATAAGEVPQGMHFAADEAEVEDAVLHAADRGEAYAAPAVGESKMNSSPVGTGAPTMVPRQTQAPEEEATDYPAGKIIRRDDLLAVFQPTLEQVHVVQYANNRITDVFSLTLREKGKKVLDLFWLGGELVAVRERAGETELLRFDVADWQSPRHLPDMTQNGTFLGAWEMGEKLFILSLHEAGEEEPLPWVNGARMNYDSVLLDAEKPGDTYAVLTVYEPGRGDGFAAETALLANVTGAADTGDGRLLLWTGDGDLYVLSLAEQGFALAAQSAVAGTILDAGPLGEGFALLLQRGDEATLLTLDADLAEIGRTEARTGAIRWGRVYEDGAVALTESHMHFLTDAGDHALNVTGDAFCWLTPDRGLLLSADGQLQAVSVLGTGLEALGSVRAREGLGSLLDDLDRLAFDMGTGRLVIPAGQTVYQYILDEAGGLTLRGEKQVFQDHDETDQRELRVLLFDERALIFHKSGIALCNQHLVRQSTSRY